MVSSLLAPVDEHDEGAAERTPEADITITLSLPTSLPAPNPKSLVKFLLSDSRLRLFGHAIID